MPDPAGMLRTSFSPELDGAADWAAMQPRDLSPWRLEKIFAGALPAVLAALHGPYYSAVETYALERRARRWIERANLKDCARQAGQACAALDYYAACLPLPGRLAALGARKAAVFGRYFEQRSLDSLQANAAGLLQALAITCLIPAEWFPLETLEKSIVKQISQAGIARAADVEVDFHLNLAPGGLRWLAGATLRAVERLRAGLAAGRPCLLRLVCGSGDLAANRLVIAYAGCDQPGGGLRLEIFEPGLDLEPHALQVQPRGEQVSVAELASPARLQPVLGLLVEAYTPAPPPPECSPGWLERRGARRAWRQLRQGAHSLRKFFMF